MSPPISLDLRERIVAWNQPVNPFAHRRTGRRRILEREDLGYIDGLFSSQPGLFLDEVQDKLQDMQDVNVSLATISRTLSHITITRKVISKEALERNKHLRATWQAVMGQ
jgi:hypothetical protein